MRTLQIIRGTNIRGQHAEAGAIIENVDLDTVALLVACGKAIEIATPHPILRATQDAPAAVEQRDPEPAHRDATLAPVAAGKRAAKKAAKP
jgi:hypothetical protein